MCIEFVQDMTAKAKKHRYLLAAGRAIQSEGK